MKTLYIEAFAGISGNMLLGALLDMGFPFSYLETELAKLHLGDYKLVREKVSKCGITATYFNVLLSHEVQETAESDMETLHEHGTHYDATHVHEHHHHHEHRNYDDILHILQGSTLDKRIQEQAAAVFKEIAIAEAKVHGTTVDKIHFHEVGAIDTIIDVVGCLLGLNYLHVQKVFISSITTGKGFVQCAHGLMPVPAPATAELLQGCFTQKGPVEKELTTPTGAALVKTLMEQSADIPLGFITNSIGYGAGTWELNIPNVLRVNMGESTRIIKNDYQEEELHLLECNIDNLDPQIYPYLLEKSLSLGALDTWLTPIIMKKGRPAQQISILTDGEKIEALQALLFTETTTLGIRDTVLKRTSLVRKIILVDTPWAQVPVKVATINGKIVNVAPEFENCKNIASRDMVPLKNVMAAVLNSYYKIYGHEQ